MASPSKRSGPSVEKSKKAVTHKELLESPKKLTRSSLIGSIETPMETRSPKSSTKPKPSQQKKPTIPDMKKGTTGNGKTFDSTTDDLSPKESSTKARQKGKKEELVHKTRQTSTSCEFQNDGQIDSDQKSTPPEGLKNSSQTTKALSKKSSVAEKQVAPLKHQITSSCDTTKTVTVLSETPKSKRVKTELPVPDSAELSDSATPVRRSRRAPVPSRKYKDMEMDFGSRKRSFTGDGLEADSKTESKAADSKPCKKLKVTVTENDDKTKGSNRSLQNTNTEVCSEFKAAVSIQNDSKNKISTELDDALDVSLSIVEKSSTSSAPVEVLQNVENEKIQSEKAQVKEMADFHKSSCDVTTELTKGKSSLIRGLGSKVSEVVVESPEKLLEIDGASLTVSDTGQITIVGQEIAFSEEDSGTVTVSTIPTAGDDAHHSPGTVCSSTDSITAHDGDSSIQGTNSQDRMDTDSSYGVHNSVVSKSDIKAPPFVTVVGQDSSTFLNLSVEATKISNFLREKKLVSKPVNSNPVKGHGRVLKPETRFGNMIIKTTINPPSSTSEVAVQAKSPFQTYSLLAPAPGSTDVSELKQKLSEVISVSMPKKGGKLHGSIKPTKSFLSPQKVVVYNHQPQLGSSTSSSVGTQASIVDIYENKKVTVLKDSDVQSKSAQRAVSSTIQDAPKVPNNEKTVKPTSVNISVPAKLEATSVKSDILIQSLKDLQRRVIIKESVNSDRLVSELPSSVPEPLTSQVASSTEVLPGAEAEKDVEVNNLQLLTQSSDHAYVENNSSKDCSASHPLGQDASSCEEADLEKRIPEDTTSSADTKDSSSGNLETHSEALLESEKEMRPDQQESSPSFVTKQNDIPSTSVPIEVPDIMKAEGEGEYTSMIDMNKNTESSTIGQIKVHDNGVEYELKIIPDDEVAEEVVDTAEENQVSHNIITEERVEAQDFGTKVVPKLEAGDVKDEMETDRISEPEDNMSGKQTSGTQTLYSSNGEVMKRQVFTSSSGPIHKLATVVNEEGQKRQYYYVSVVPNKSFDGKFKSPGRSSSVSCLVNENGFYCCGKCNYKTDRKANFYKHRRLHTGSKPHSCPVCKYKAGTSSNLKRHMGIHDNIRQHKCNVCDLCFRQKIHLERHIKYKHEEKRVKCPLCDYICANEQPDLKMHMRRKHSNETSGEVSTCSQCNLEFNSKKDLKQHMKFHKDGPELKLFCKECSFVTDCQSRLKRHSAIHEKVKPFMCGICQYRAAQKEHVVRHLRTQHKIEVKKEKKRAWKRRQIPDKLSNRNDDTEDNVRECADFSSGDKIFACNHCTMRFAKLINLYKHLHTQHQDIMPTETEGNYYCVVCEFFTSTKKNLLVHMRRHNMTDQTPPTHVYSCVLCRYVNPRRRNLFQHMRKKHNIDISSQTDSGLEGEEEGASLVPEVGLNNDVKPIPKGTVTSEHFTPVTAEVTESIRCMESLLNTAIDETEGEQDIDGYDPMLKVCPALDIVRSACRISYAPSYEQSINEGLIGFKGRVVGDDIAGVANMIKIEDLTRVNNSEKEIDSHHLVIDTRGVGEMPEIQVVETPSVLEHHTDAIGGLQTLAEQAGLIDTSGHVEPIVDEPQSHVEQQLQPETVSLTTPTAATFADGSIIITTDGSLISENAVETVSGEQIHEIVESVDGMDSNSGTVSLEMSEDQLSSLRSGDMVEMDGDLYLVDLTQDPSNPNKQLLSFMPVSSA